jgi:6-phosphogluconolactonase
MPRLSHLLTPLVIAMALTSGAVHARTFVYVSNATDGTISTFRMAEDSGELTPVQTANAGKNVMPMAVSPDRRHLYAAVRSTPYSVQSFAIDTQDGHLNLLATTAVDESLAYISLDNTGNTLFGSSYDNDVLTVNPVRNGLVAGPATQTLKTEQHAHSVRIDQGNHFLYVANLGGQQVYQYRFDAASGTVSANAPAKVAAPQGIGPRHLEFSPDNRFVYVLGELQNSVVTYALDSASGQLKELAVTSGQPADSGLKPGAPRGPDRVKTAGMQPHADNSNDIWAADIHITSDGKFLYTSERTSSVLSLFRVDKASGALTFVSTFATERQPRGFAITPDSRFLICSGEKSTQVAVFSIDAATGHLARTSQAPVGNGANWVAIVKR